MDLKEVSARIVANTVPAPARHGNGLMAMIPPARSPRRTGCGPACTKRISPFHESAERSDRT